MIKFFRCLIAQMISEFSNSCKKMILLSDNPTLYLGKKCRFQNPKYIKFGENVVLGENTRLLCTDEYRGYRFLKSPRLRIGNSFHCTRNMTIQCAGNIEIGDNVLVASDVFIIDYNHGTSPCTENYLDNDLEISDGIKICDGVWIGNGAVILGGISIGKKSIIGAGSVVTKDIPEYSMAVGNPARVIKRYDNAIEKWITIDTEKRE